MKTTLVVLNWNDRFGRGAMPGEVDKESIYHMEYTPAHTADLERLNLSTMKTYRKKEHRKERITIRSNSFEQKNGKVDRVRHLPAPVVETLDQLDQERDKLKALIREIEQKEYELLKTAYEQSEPVRMHEVRGFKGADSTNVD